MTLYIVGTPIGNLEDITLRALRVLREVSLIAAENTRKAGTLLSHFQIATPVTSYFEGNERRRIPEILDALERGDVALISEAGMPGVSDPGYPLIAAAAERGVPIVPIPGPSAHTAALVVSGLPTDQFLFVGFLPRKHADDALHALAPIRATLVFYEAPHRLEQTLALMYETLGNRAIALCRELTKLYEEVWRGDVESAQAWVAAHPPRGEYTLVVAGAVDDHAVWDEERVRTALAEHLAEGFSRSQAAREVASLAGWERRRVYELGD
ncbi:MAG: 16S rRNA (cytidine(1402)-2'-O)-methyltransferase [Anaerolineae bacterium]|jgi:16S rRNA (cytidine1402-2'-O)-methyltransferase|nr:16S rRNA (cytidine(1402)-2'-O)-methyltransferase [Anaerolineae bacterium]